MLTGIEEKLARRLAFAVLGLTAAMWVIGGPLASFLLTLTPGLDRPGTVPQDVVSAAGTALLVGAHMVVAGLVVHWEGLRGISVLLTAVLATALSLVAYGVFVWSILQQPTSVSTAVASGGFVFVQLGWSVCTVLLALLIARVAAGTHRTKVSS